MSPHGRAGISAGRATLARRWHMDLLFILEALLTPTGLGAVAERARFVISRLEPCPPGAWACRRHQESEIPISEAVVFFLEPFDYPVMTVTEKPRSDEWVTGDDGPARLALFVDVEDAMRAGARKGIRRVVGSVPSEHDVEDVVVQSFNELWRLDRSGIESLTGMAYRIAYRRGMDRGDRVLRERRDDRAVRKDLFRLSDEESDQRQIEDATTLAIVQRCKEHLTIDQRAVISATVEGTIDGTMPLKEYAKGRGTSYEACRRMVNRAIAALTKCLEAALRTEKSDGG